KVQMRCTIWPRDGDWVLADESGQPIVTESGQEIWLMDTQTITIGTWYINTRATDTRGWVTLTCYDKMLRLNKYTVKKAAKKYGVKLTYPVDIFQITELAEKVTGLAEPPLEDASGLAFTKDDVGELTMREALGYVAAANGANLSANADGTAMVALHYGFYNVDAPYIYTTQDDTHELVDETGEYIVYYDEDSAAMFLEPSHMAELDLGETLPEVTAVEVSGPDDDATWTATAEEATTAGTTYAIDWPLSCGSQQVANQMIAAIGYFAYTPWDARSVLLDPSVQVGDVVIVDGVETVISEITATCGGTYVADCGAAGDYAATEEL
ncbi:MAG: hypothetical protein Q4G01_06975, partial [Eubacteriales bacterium]|nr:hypothetical protein [Eubacteriales bacterium]